MSSYSAPRPIRADDEDLESLEATVELLRDPQAQERVRSSERDIEYGRVLDEDAVRAMLAKPADSE